MLEKYEILVKYLYWIRGIFWLIKCLKQNLRFICFILGYIIYVNWCNLKIFEIHIIHLTYHSKICEHIIYTFLGNLKSVEIEFKHVQYVMWILRISTNISENMWRKYLEMFNFHVWKFDFAPKNSFYFFIDKKIIFHIWKIYFIF